jgi:UDP-glucuronate decarboxylase
MENLVMKNEFSPGAIKSAQDVVDTDLAYICRHLEQSFAGMAGKRLLITGGAGFLGHYLVQSVLHWNRTRPEYSIRLAVFDSFIRGVPAWLTRCKSESQFDLVKHDVRDPLPADMGSFQYLIHAASIASPMYYRKYPIETMDANVNGLRSLLDYCLRQQERGEAVDGFLYFSTSEIYGDPVPESIPTPETYRGNVSCTGPRACYDESKRYGETLCVNFAERYGLPVRIARPFNNYGPGLKITDGRALPDFARDVLAGRDIVLLSDGAPTRTFCYVADAVVGYYKILTRGKNGEAYNIGVETPEISIRELADRVTSLASSLFGYKGKVVHKVSADKNYLVDNPNRRCPIIAKARTDLGYAPSISLETGLTHSLLWYRDNREAEES